MFAWIIGLLAALIGVGAGIYFALRAIGFFQYLGGKKSRAAAVSKEELIDKLLALNNPSKPYQIQKGNDTDLIAEWKIVDTSWYGTFSKSGFSEAHREYLLADESRHSVRCFEEFGSVSWSAGTDGPVPAVHYQKSFFRGRVLYKKEWGKQYDIKDPLTMEISKVYEYKFDIDEIRGPIISVVRENGWEWVPVTAKRYVTYQK
jgi:hypothetical protein